MNIFKMVFGRKKVMTNSEVSELEDFRQEKAKLALRNAAIAAAQESFKAGALTKSQTSLIITNMKVNPSLRTILDKLINTLESNKEFSQAALIRELDNDVFKGSVSQCN